MNLENAAKKLTEIKTSPERKKLLKLISAEDLPELARAVKEICYSFWTSEPTKAQSSAEVLEEIYKFSPQTEIKAYSDWIKGIAEITRGKLYSAANKLDESAAAFSSLGKEHEAAQTQVAKLYALALLGNFEEAIETGNKVLKIFEKHGDQLAAGKVEKNLGNIVSRHELHSQAEKFYRAARQRFVKLRNFEELTMVENGLAITYSALNDFKKAEKFYAQALDRARRSKRLLTQAEIEASMGNLALFRGKLDEALKFLELSRRKYEILRMPHQMAVAELEIADIYLELNLTAEAFSIYETVADELRKLKLQGEEARARANFGRAAAILGQTATARRELKKAARLYVLEKNNVGAATVKLHEATLELNLRKHRKVLKLSEEAATLFNQSENSRHLPIARWLQAEAQRHTGETEKARQSFVRIFNDSLKREQPLAAQAAQTSLGTIAAAEKNYRQAETHFKRAIRLIETVRAPLAAEEFRMAFLANKLAPFENLAKTYLAQKKFESALATIERARGRVLTETLRGAAQKTIRRGSEKLFGKLEALREELNWFYSRLNRAAETEIENLQTEAKKRERQIADVMRQIESTGEANHAKQDSLDCRFLQKQLGEEKALIEFVDFDNQISAFVLTDKKIYYAANLAKASEIIRLLESLQFQFDALRFGAKSLGNHLGELKKRADFYLQKLHEKLLAPLEKFCGARNLIVVPVGALHYVPFHALFDGEQYSIQKRETVYAPSATVWSFLASKSVPKLQNALLIGFADERIPFVNREIKALSGIFKHSKSYIGEQATFAAFAKNAAHFDVLHLACHGNFRPENPLFSSLHLADGWITVRDVCAQRLKAEVITLSACETGLSKIFAGDEILGLARGFLAAGARSLVLSLWTVNDEATTVLMKDFYEQLQTGATAAAALRRAQCRFIERGVHPYFWSPFALIGR